MAPTTGRTVLYVLTTADAQAISRRRIVRWPEGAQAHIGNHVAMGDVVPMTVVRVWPDEFGPGVPGVNGQAILDGNDTLWVTSAREGDAGTPGTWHWPPRV